MPIPAWLGVALGITPALQSAAQTGKTSKVNIAGDQFMRDGKPYRIISGGIHYPHMPREYRLDRLRKAHAFRWGIGPLSGAICRLR
jgi:beta-galactosidase